MPSYKMVALSNPVAGREEECDRWYQQQHLPDVVQLPGFESAQRFHLAHPIEEQNPYQFLAIYDIVTEDLMHSLMALVNGAKSGELEVSDALDTSSSYAVIYTPSGEPVRKIGYPFDQHPQE